MFRMYGRKVEILKYQVSYQENEEQQTYYAASEEEANEIAARVNGTVFALPDSGDAWMDGMEVDDVPDTYAAAMQLCQMGEAGFLDAEKKRKIQQSKEDLESYLEAHPLLWTDGEYYSITSDKQRQLTSKITSATMAQTLSQSYTLTWNSTGDVCKTWELSELVALAFAIDARVTRLVSYQQAQEVTMRNAETLEELDAITVDYDEVV